MLPCPLRAGLGIAVLGYDKRGYVPGGGKWREPDVATLAADAAAAVRFAAAQPGIDRSRVDIFGSSQAGWVVPRAAVAATDTDFIILRAGAGTSHLDTVLHEARQELRESGLSGLDLDYAMALRRELYELAMRGEPIEHTDALVAPYLKEPWYRAAFGDGPVSALWSARWWAWAQRNLAVDPAASLAQFDGKVLWFLAGADENVPLVQTRAALERAFAAAEGDSHEVVVLAGAQHAFLVPEPGGQPRYSSGFFDSLRRWLHAEGIAMDACWDQ